MLMNSGSFRTNCAYGSGVKHDKEFISFVDFKKEL